MTKIKIVTDSTADLSTEEISRYNIEVVPLSIHIDEKSYTDRVDISPEEFMDKMREAKELPKTSQPPAGSFLNLYESLYEQGYEVISIHMSAKMSGTVQAAETAASLSKANVTVIDSTFISRALSFQVLEAAKMAQEGKSIHEILTALEKIRFKTRLLVYVDTLENLSKGGRIGKGKALIGALLNVKPIAAVIDGEYTPMGRVRNQTQAVNLLVKHFASDIKDRVLKRVDIAHAEGMEMAQRVRKAILELTGHERINITFTTPVISTHTGPGAIALMYWVE